MRDNRIARVMLGQITPEMFAGSPFESEFKRQAPKPADFPILVRKLKALDMTQQNWPVEDIKKISAPTLVISADSEVVRPEHSLDIFRLRGGGPSVDFMTVRQTELAVLPGTTHMGVLQERAAIVTSFVAEFFDRKMP